MANVTGILLAGREGIGRDFAVYRGASDNAGGVGDGVRLEVEVEVEGIGAVVWGETDPEDGEPPSPGLGIRRPPVCISRRARRAVVIAGRDMAAEGMDKSARMQTKSCYELSHLVLCKGLNKMPKNPKL